MTIILPDKKLIDLLHTNPQEFIKFISNYTNASLNLSNGNIKQLEAGYIAQAIESNSYIKYLILNGNDLNVGISHITNALKNNSSIISLSLRGSRIGPNGARHIADMLKVNSSIKSINLLNNMISISGDQYITEAFESNFYRKSIDLRYNHLYGANAFVDALSHNFSLIVLELEGNNIMDDVLEIINDKIHRNKMNNNRKALSLEQILYINLNDDDIKYISHGLLEYLESKYSK